MTECKQNHQLCSTSSYAMPMRLLYLGSEDNVRLINIEEKSTKEYTALSYCWGGDQPFRTTKSSLSAWVKGQAVDILPRTIQDAITVAIKPGIQYIWIDSLCIVQDETHDVTQEVIRMGDIYRGATLVISAARAKHSDEGFLVTRDLEDYGQILKLQYLCKDGKPSSIICCRDLALKARRLRREPIHSKHGHCKRLSRLGECLLSVRFRQPGFATKHNMWTVVFTLLMTSSIPRYPTI